jgi:gas vesicle protein
MCTSNIGWLIGGMALGALTMYMMDPDRGNRRRALARDKIYSAAIKTRKCVNRTSRDWANRAQGLRAKAEHMMP